MSFRRGLTDRESLAMLQIVTDTWEKLSKCDVERLILAYGRIFGEVIIDERPDLAEECVKVCRSLYGHSF